MRIVPLYESITEYHVPGIICLYYLKKDQAFDLRSGNGGGIKMTLWTVRY